VRTEQPNGVLVVGDVNSTLACALVAAKHLLQAPFRCALGERRRPAVIHVEAGLRSFDDDMPEEVNRKLTDAISDLLFVSDPAGLDNLRKEGVPEAKVVFVGNVMIDTLLAAREQAMQSAILDKLGLGGRRRRREPALDRRAAREAQARRDNEQRESHPAPLNGSLIVMVVPRPSSLRTSMEPSCICTMR